MPEGREDTEKLREFDRNVEQADVFIILIDGLKLLKIMPDGPRPNPWLDPYLSSRLATLARVAADRGRWLPVHFAITKWDLFDGRYMLDRYDRTGSLRGSATAGGAGAPKGSSTRRMP